MHPSLRMMFMSRLHERDLPVMVEIPPGYAMSSSLGRADLQVDCYYPNDEVLLHMAKEASLGITPVGVDWRLSYEDEVIAQHIPWLDGARECLMMLDTWAQGG